VCAPTCDGLYVTITRWHFSAALEQSSPYALPVTNDWYWYKSQQDSKLHRPVKAHYSHYHLKYSGRGS